LIVGAGLVMAALVTLLLMVVLACGRERGWRSGRRLA